MLKLKEPSRFNKRQNDFQVMNETVVDVEWSIGSTHDSGARGPGFDSHPDPSFRQRT
jgi:hypothetical protein